MAENAIFKGQIVARHQIVAALRAFDTEYPDTNLYRRWMEKGNYKYVLWHDGKRYPPKHILSQATGIATADFGGGIAETNRVLKQLEFTVVPKQARVTDGSSH